MKKLIIFGGTGYLGTNLATSLSKDFYVSVTGRRDRSLYSRNQFKDCNIDYHKLEIKHLPSVYRLIDQNDLIIFAVPNTQPHQPRPILHSDYLEIIKPSEKIFKYASQRAKRIIFLSSGGSVYGDGRDCRHSEDSNAEPTNRYGKYKLRLDKSLLYLNSTYHSNNVVLRVANPYGRTFNDLFTQGFINSLIRNVRTNKYVEIWGNGNQIRDFIFMDDIVNLVRIILNKEGADGVFNCGTGIGNSLKDILDISEDILKSKVLVKYISSYKEKISSNILNIDKSLTYFNWTPKNTLQDILPKLLLGKQI
jgi:UDP-glucose 4-epimerase